jgi:hypothetical protein
MIEDGDRGFQAKEYYRHHGVPHSRAVDQASRETRHEKAAAGKRKRGMRLGSMEQKEEGKNRDKGCDELPTLRLTAAPGCV